MKLSPTDVETMPVSGSVHRLLRTPGVEPGTVKVCWRHGPFTWCLTDSASMMQRLPTMVDSAFHLLYSQREDLSWIKIGRKEFAAKPGDSILFYRRDQVIVSPGQLFVTMHIDGSSQRRKQNLTHGTESFVGHNRRTIYDRTPRLGFDRWKLTQPLRLTSPEPCPVLAIFGKIGVIEGTQLYTLHAGESMIFTGTVDLLPDGLAYCMTMWNEKLGQGPLAEPGRSSSTGG